MKTYAEGFKYYLLAKFAYCRENGFICGYVLDRENFSVVPGDSSLILIDIRLDVLDYYINIEKWEEGFLIWLPTLNYNHDIIDIYLDNTELSYDDLFKKYFIVLKEVKE